MRGNILNILVIAATFILFTLALFFKGMTHDILLEAGVLLVSVKLILLASASNRRAQQILSELKTIRQMLEKK